MYSWFQRRKVLTMASAAQMSQTVAELFMLTTTTVDGISRALQENGLRTSGGKGRGAAPMTAKDFLNLAIAAAAGVGMRDAPDFVRSVIELPLSSGEIYEDDHIVSEIPKVVDGRFHGGSTLLQALWSQPIAGLNISEKLGPVVSSFIEGVLSKKTSWSQAARVELEISNIGPTAQFKFDYGDQSLYLNYAPEGFVKNMAPAWERRIILRDPIFRKMIATHLGETR